MECKRCLLWLDERDCYTRNGNVFCNKECADKYE